VVSRLDLNAFEVLTFDCYGTLINWEAGLLDALRPVLKAHGASLEEERLLELYGTHESAIEAGPYRRYREVLGSVLRAIGAELGFEPDEAEVRRFAGSVGLWPPFPDSPAALAQLSRRFRLAVMTNCDDDLFEDSRRQLGIQFDEVVTAEQAGAYKPDHRVFELALERIGVPRERVLHVAQSLYHDHLPAKQLGLSTIWVDRRRGRPGFGATPPAEATPDLVVPGMRELAELANSTSS
jgi:2-haloacid dehalogenase